MRVERAAEDFRSAIRRKPGCAPDSEVRAVTPEVIGKTRHGDPLKAIKSHDGARICYSDHNPKKPVSDIAIVMLPGWGCYPSIYGQQAALLGKHFRIIKVRTRGHFESELGASTTATYIHDCAKDVAVILKSEGIKRTILVGHSMGGLTALEFYKEFNGDKIAAMALLSAPYGDPFKTLPVNLQRLGPWVDLLSFELEYAPFIDRLKNTWLVNNALFRRIFYSLITGTVFRNSENGLDNEELKLLMQRALEVPVETMAMALRAMRRMNLYPFLKDIHAPTLVLAGLNDVLVHWRHGEEIASVINSGNGGNMATFVKMACGHMPMMEFPEKFNHLFLTFLLEKVPELRGSERLKKVRMEVEEQLRKKAVEIPFRIETWHG
ncbi:MAG: alpha/beta hydrolase [Candidatus Micrarchaeia archaeon]